MVATLQTTNIQNASSSTTNLALDTSGNVTVGSSLTAANNITATSGTVVMASSFLRNRIINGGMQIWQRGTSFSSGYTADRWFIAYGTSPTFSQSTDVPSTGGFQYSMSVSGSGQPTLAQRIESLNCKDLGGATVTISFWAKLTSGSGNLYAFLVYPSAADNYTTTTTSSNYSFTPTSSWAYYTITIPSISSNAVNGLGLSITSVSTSSITFLITGVQLEVGSVATPFERRQYGQEVALCQRYYCKTFSLGTAPGNNVTSTGALKGATRNGSANEPSANWKFPVSMRTEPTVTLYNTGSGTAGQWSNDGTSTSSSNARSQWISTEGCAMDNTGNAFNYTSNIQASASAEL